jgi:putative phosphoribosyl transferase
MGSGCAHNGKKKTVMTKISNVYKDEYTVRLPLGRPVLDGSLGIPRAARGVVVFPCVGGNLRRNGYIHFLAAELRKQGLATLLVNLLSMEEDVIDMSANRLRFNIRFLASRLIRVSRWLEENALAEKRNVCYFAFNTATAAALVAASRRPGLINSLVLSSARADLASDVLSAVSAPVLFLVGEKDYSLIDINREALLRVSVPCQMAVLAGMERTREKLPALKESARRAARWFRHHLAAVSAAKKDGAVAGRPEEAYMPELVNV